VDSLFITGANGFVGRHVLGQLKPGRYRKIVCLSRSHSRIGPEVLARKDVQFVCGDVAEPAQYERELASVECVIHLAAVTGKAKPEDYFRVNVAGTRALLDACRRAGVPRFLHVSSIAAKFPGKTRYFYAQSKEESEALVRDSGLRYTIVRPTMILGRGSPVWLGLSKLAALPILVIFGTGKTQIQPISVGDLVDSLLNIVDADRFQNETLEIGGRDSISIEEFLARAHQRLRGRLPRRLHLPMGLILPVLTLLEMIAYSFLPLTVGQLSSFRYDGTPAAHPDLSGPSNSRKGIDEILEECASDAR
jgi:nucleoside-diphosphate-sugar epimerase